MKGLIIKPKWADLILDRNKIMELRSSNTLIRGAIGLVKSGSKMVYGTVELVDSIPLDKSTYNYYKSWHKVDLPYEQLPYKKTYGWILSNPIKFDKPIPYNHKQGCVIWVNLEGDIFEDMESN